MKLALVMFLHLTILVILFGGIFYQCITSKENTILSSYIWITFYINYLIVFSVIADWLKKIFDIKDN